MRQATAFNKERACAAAKAALEYVLAHAKTDNRAGGYFAIYRRGIDGSVGQALVLEVIGAVIAEKLTRYSRFVREKITRLSQHPDHLSSHQSRNPDKDLWDGAIVAGDYYFSFSGLPDYCDEALVLIAARMLGVITVANAARIAELSDNTIYNHWAATAQIV